MVVVGLGVLPMAPLAAQSAVAASTERQCAAPIPGHLRRFTLPEFAKSVSCLDPVTIVIDFIRPGEPAQADVFGNLIAPIDVTNFGLGFADLDALIASIFVSVQEDYFGIPSSDEWPSSPFLPAEAFNVAVLQGDAGHPPSNGASEYYVLLVGTLLGSQPLVGGQVAMNAVRDAQGNPSGIPIGSKIGSVFTNQIGQVSSLVSSTEPAGVAYAFTVDLTAVTIAHEIGHAVSLEDVVQHDAVTAHDLSPVMGHDFIAAHDAVVGHDILDYSKFLDSEFALSASKAQTVGAQQFSIGQLIDALGLRPDSVWVDFGYTGASCGTSEQPLVSLEAAAHAVAPSGEVWVAAGSSPEVFTIATPMTIRTSGGTVTIGGL